jgi:hypothetical protein
MFKRFKGRAAVTYDRHLKGNFDVSRILETSKYEGVQTNSPQLEKFAQQLFSAILDPSSVLSWGGLLDL